MPISYRQHIAYPTAPARQPVKATRSRYRAPEDRGRAWSDAEEVVLRLEYRRLSSEELAVQLGRTVKSVNHRASRMGLKR